VSITIVGFARAQPALTGNPESPANPSKSSSRGV